MSQTVPDFTTAIVTILFLLALGIVAFVVKKKSGPIKKIIKNQNNLEVLNQLSLRDGYLAYVLKVGEENFFFIGHKSGRGSLTQINNNSLNNENTKKINIDELSSKNILKSKSSLPDKSNEAKPLQHVNISDLLTAHKKGGRDA
jgi:flagellar biogenesis protein FliO